MCRTNKRKQRCGLTLIEILLVAAMLSVVTLAIYSTFNSGVKIWQRLIQGMPAEDLNIFFEKISNDLRNSFRFSGIEFVGEKDTISFATLVTSVMTEMGQKERVLGIGEVGYCFDAQTETLSRWQADYSQVYQNKSTPLRQIMSNVKSLSFQYYYSDPQEEAYIWKDLWREQEEPEKEGTIPLAVRIEIEFDEDAERKKVRRTITIPTGG